MEQKLFTEFRPLYATSRKNPNSIRIKIRMSDLIDPEALRHAVDMTMKRYPYFCVELQKKEGDYIFEENHRPVVVTNSLAGVELNSEESNYHMLAFGWYDNQIVFDIFHGMTDGTGAYEVVRTFLYYYCSERYGAALKKESIRLAGDEISDEEWTDPVYNSGELPVPERTNRQKPFDLLKDTGVQSDHENTLYSVAVSEDEFMQFVKENDGTPATAVSLLFSKAVAELYPNAEAPVRVILCVNQRNALNKPLAHHSLVGGAYLEYKKEIQDRPFKEQIKAYREMVAAQTDEKSVLQSVNNQKMVYQMFGSLQTDHERIAFAEKLAALTSDTITATVSYVGKADFKEAEKYVRDFHLLTCPPTDNTMLIEISAVNGRFIFDIIQPFSTPVFVNAFLDELDKKGVTYDLQNVDVLKLANIRLPWAE